MAKARVTINPMYKGGAGGYSFYVRGGEQVIRQRKNNSNYGESASRTRAQMIRRIMWGNLVNCYKQISRWQKKAYDGKLGGQSDYNLFMKLNIARASVGTTRQANEQGFAVWEAYQVSQGSLPVVGYSLGSSPAAYVTDIIVKNAITAATTIGDLSSDIIANNPQFQDGDNIAFIFFVNWQKTDVEWPYATSIYTEITLDKSSTTLLGDVPDVGERLIEDVNDNLTVTFESSPVTEIGHEVGFACIHTRKVNGNLKVSSQSILLNEESLIAQYSGDEWYQHCIDSYGVNEEVPLDPNFRDGIITQVTANGVVIENAASLSGSQVVRVYGNKLYGNGYSFSHNGIEYVPLSSTDEYDEYVLTDNGSYVIYIDGQRYMSFSVQGIVVPTEMTGSVLGYYRTANDELIQSTIQSASNSILNYDVAPPSGAGFIEARLVYKEGSNIQQSDFEVIGAELEEYTDVQAQRYVDLKLSIPTGSQRLYCRYKGFIFFVTAYSV